MLPLAPSYRGSCGEDCPVSILGFHPLKHAVYESGVGDDLESLTLHIIAHILPLVIR